MAKALAARADKTKKATADDDKKKAELQRMLLSQKSAFKEEQMKAKRVQRELELEEMKQQGGDSAANIILPKYEKNEDLNVYMEIDQPPKSLYKAIGYNDLQRVQLIMEGNDSEKRSSDFQNQKTMMKQSSLRKSAKGGERMTRT